MIISQSGMVDIIPEYNRALRPIFCVSEGDADSRMINLTVKNAGELFAIPEGASVYVAGKKIDNTIFTYECSYSGYIVTFPITEQMSAVSGLVLCELQIVVAGDPLGSANFCFWVEPSPIENGSTSSSDLNIFTEAISVLGDYSYLSREIGVLSSRMDEFAKLPDGSLSTAADAELVDIRAMTNGETAVTAGDAVREQVSEITYKMERVVSENYWNEGDAVSGYKAANGSTGSNNTYEYLAHAIPVTEGDVVRAYEISTVDRFTTAGMRWLCALDANRNPVTSAGSNSNITSYTVPSGIAYVIPTMNVGGKKRMITINKEATAYVDYEMPHYIAGDEFHSDISMTDTDFDTAYLDWSRVNRMNPNTCQTGKSINTSTGIVFDSDNYFITDFMEIREGETLHMITLTNNPSTFVNRFAAFDKDKNILPDLGKVDSSPDIAQTGEMAYIRVVFIYAPSDIYRTPYGIVCMPTSDPEYIPGFGAAPEIKTEYLRPVVKIMADDTARTVVDKLVSAYSKGQCDIYFERATYDLSAVVASVKEDYHLFASEIPIGNNCRYFFNGATIKASVDLSQHPATGGEEFYCNLLGCQRRPSSYELHDGVLEATDTRYVVHDESSALKGSYKHLYQNMEMIYHTNARTEAIRKCIGGGTGASGVVEIVGCKFITDGSDACVSFHGNGTDVTGAQFDLNVRDSWFFNSLRTGELSASQTARLQYCGNSAAAAPSVYAGWTATIFNNETR